MEKLLFLKGVFMQELPVSQEDDMQTPIELSDIYIEQMGRKQAKLYDIKKKTMIEDSDQILELYNHMYTTKDGHQVLQQANDPNYAKSRQSVMYINNQILTDNCINPRSKIDLSSKPLLQQDQINSIAISDIINISNTQQWISGGIKQEQMWNKQDNITEQYIEYKGPKLKGLLVDNMDELKKVISLFQGFISCFYCTTPIDQPVFVLKMKYNQMKVKSVFCSFVCAFSECKRIKNVAKAARFKECIQSYYKLLYGKKLEFKNIVICREDYIRFGGPMNHQQFIQHIKQQEASLLNNTHCLIPPLIAVT